MQPWCLHVVELNRVQTAHDGKMEIQTITYSSHEDRTGRAIVQHKCKFAIEVSHDLVCRVRSPVPQGSVGLDDEVDLSSTFAQPVLLLQHSHVLDRALEQAEYVVHNTEQPTNENDSVEEKIRN